MSHSEWLLPARETLAARALRTSSAEQRVAALASELESAQDELLARENDIAFLQASLDSEAGENSRLSDSVTQHAAAAEEAKSQIERLRAALAAARDELLRRENDIAFLQASLDSEAGENSRLSHSLAQNAGAAEEAKSQIERLRAALAAAQQECDIARQLRQTESSELNSRLEMATARAIAAEQHLAQAQLDLRTRDENNSDLERKLAGAENALREKEQQVDELTRARSMLMDDLSRLLAISQTRDADLARAKENNDRLVDLFVQLEAKVQKSTSGQPVEAANSRLQDARARIAAAGFDNRGPTDCAVLRRDLEKDAWLLGHLPSANAA
jgi:chromosome segregation ATPase